MAVKSSWTGKSGARGILMEREKGKRPHGGSSEGLENRSKR